MCPLVYLLSDVLVSHVAGPGLGDEAGSLKSGAAAVRLVPVFRQTGQQEAVRQEALPGQHDAAQKDRETFMFIHMKIKLIRI